MSEQPAVRDAAVFFIGEHSLNRANGLLVDIVVE